MLQDEGQGGQWVVRVCMYQSLTTDVCSQMTKDSATNYKIHVDIKTPFSIFFKVTLTIGMKAPVFINLQMLKII